MNWISENRLLVFGIVLIAGFVGVTVTQNGQASETANPTTSSSKTASFKQVNPTSEMTKGDANAPVSLIQYSDFICPSCSYFSTQIMPTIEEKYIKTGKVKFEFRPMAFIADGSTQAGMGGFCALDQNKFWQFHDATYAVVADKVFKQGLDPKRGDTILTAPDVKNIAASAGLDSKSFDTCLDTKKHNADIVSATKTANANGVNSTPYIMINDQEYRGDISLVSIEAIIKTKL